jgi:NADP-dependent 3-hydroxy acid dehydrogenase YdfG
LDHVANKSIIITGAGGGFGRLTSERLALRGARLTCADVDEEAVAAVAAAIRAAGGEAQAIAADVAAVEDMRRVASRAISVFGAIDVLVNNAGIMPLAFVGDHTAAHDAWSRCIDINFKGVVNGTAAVYDQMVAQGRGHVINVSSIFGNTPVVGASVYGATKAAVDYFSHAFRQEARGKIKVTVIKPTGVRATNLSKSVINSGAAVGALGPNQVAFYDAAQKLATGTAPAEWSDPGAIDYNVLAPEFITDAIVHVIDQPWGVAISDMTVRAAGDFYVM